MFFYSLCTKLSLLGDIFALFWCKVFINLCSKSSNSDVKIASLGAKLYLLHIIVSINLNTISLLVIGYLWSIISHAIRKYIHRGKGITLAVAIARTGTIDVAMSIFSCLDGFIN